MCMKVFFAGASGAIGQRLLPMLLERGYQVLAITRSVQRAAALEAAGARALVLDVYDAEALQAAVLAFQPRWMIHQLSDLPAGLDPALMPAAQPRNARLRREGTANLVAAARAAGVERMVAQSIAWAYAPGQLPLHEEQPLDLGAEGARAVSVAGVAALEAAVLGARPMEGIVLRYGRLYGPGTGAAVADPRLSEHVDDAARAALLALEWGVQGAYNVAEQDIEVSSAKARHRLGWQPGLRLAEVPA